MPSENSYPGRYDKVQQNARRLGSARPEVMTTFDKFHKAAVATGALETKVKELIALAISVTARCDDCIAHHVHDALDAGATRDEIIDAIGVAMLMGGGPGMIYATHAIEALDQFTEVR